MKEHLVRGVKVPIRSNSQIAARNAAINAAEQLCDFMISRRMDWSNLAIDLTFTTFEVIGELKEEIT